MTPDFNVNEYWLKRGRRYSEEQRLQQEYYRMQEHFVIDVIRSSGIPMGTVLEVGCGHGRITRLLAEAFPEARILAADLSPDLLESARRACADCRNVTFQSYDFYSSTPLPGPNPDLILAIEVLMHQPEEVVRQLARQFAAVAQHVVSLDWSEDFPWPTERHVWIHDYPRIYSEAGLQCVAFVLPQRIEGKQQRLFLAGRNLAPSIAEMAGKLNPAESSEPSGNGAREAVPSVPELNWTRQLGQATEEILRIAPPGATIIMVNDDQWGNDEAFPGRRLLPFVEKDGLYWGPPADDTEAIQELERLISKGAHYVVVGWNSFWWLEHYTGLRAHLRSRYPCILANERLRVYRIKRPV